MKSKHVYIQTPHGDRVRVKKPDLLKRASYRWNHILQTRQAWRNRQDERQSLDKQCYKQLKDLGLTASDFQKLCGSDLIEVSIPFRSEAEDWAARIFPWEFVLAQAIRYAGRRDYMAIVRHLNKQRPTKIKPPRKKQKVTIVTSAPGKLRSEFDFDTEIRLVREALGETENSDRLQFINNPTIEKLEKQLRDHQPDIIHVSAVDNHQGATEFKIATPDQRVFDGLLLKGQDKDGTQAVSFETIANAMAIGSRKPYVVGLNSFFSAARLAPITVAEGARAAIGFQDRIDDAIAESFYSYFYGELVAEEEQTSLHMAFSEALQNLFRSSTNLTGTGIAFWSSTSVLGERTWDDDSKRRRKRPSTVSQSATPTEIFEEIEVKPKPKLNYSLLHNQRPLFDSFVIETKQKNVKVPGVEVSVELQAGSETPSFQTTLTLEQQRTHLADKIFIPLTWIKNIATESVRSNLLVDVSWRGHTIYSRSHSVKLLPPEEWVDSDDSRQSLPSFVFPRDPAVKQVIAAAEKYLTSLSDHQASGFDGYQSLDDDDTTGVDNQVKAIWTTLVHDFALSYINPPPSFSDESQRLRTPENIIGNRRGTCIDLSLLLAACLEYVEIYPVIFLLEGHAFPGYWRRDEYQHEFVFPTDKDVQDAESQYQESNSNTIWQQAPWLFGAQGDQNTYEKVLQQVQDERLVPLESVGITQQYGFEDAVKEGWHNLAIEAEFHSLTDILTARQQDITPLPIHLPG